MSGFALCTACQAEYDDPADRRFHAQPIACPRCGPALELLDPQGKSLATGPSALEAAQQAICAGQIVALKGLGGFQLLVDATNAEAVGRLRSRKARPHRPLAVMFPALADVEHYCELSAEEARALQSHEAPILLLRRLAVSGRGSSHDREAGRQGDTETGRDAETPRRGDAGTSELSASPRLGVSAFSSPPLADTVAPGNPYLGVMLPYTPLHHLLMAALARPVVCTSGNLSEEPMAIDTPDALVRLAPIADRLLVHDRPIVRPVDDSVARFGPQGLAVLRRARGYAPLPIRLRFAAPPILALGGHLKNTVALSLGDGAGRTSVVLSPHVGDLDNVLSVEVFRRAIDNLVQFFAVVPQHVACDLHPDYASTRQAEELASRWNVPLVRVQHHHAHVAACMAEHGLEGPVLGLAWDGTGYGPDGTVWGGEALVCRGGEFRRLATCGTFGLPGGDRAVREPRRTALGLLFEILGPGALALVEDWFRPAQRKVLTAVLANRLHAPRTSSMGRLFDAVAALVGLPPVVTFEAQAAMALEFAADRSVQEAYPLPLARERSAVSDQRSAGAKPEGSPLTPHPSPLPDSPLATRHSPLFTADWEPLVRAVLADRAAGEPVGRISARFHNALAELAVAIARQGGCGQVCLSGGCFQNALLTERVFRRLTAAGYSVFLHRQVPPGDGGIALGQVFVAACGQLSVAGSQLPVAAENREPNTENRTPNTQH